MIKQSMIAAMVLAVLIPTTAQALPVSSSTSIVIAQSRTDTKALRQAIVAALRQPGLPQPQIQKLVTEGSYGLASWTMGEAGGIVALVWDENWEVYRMGGGMPSATDINNRCDMPIPVAQRLLNRI
jgi:hypothetical protein